ncbi:aminotransferase class I/II-fold pyridoxal phosphate-dependent enzyme [Algicola sagamiensis]|uniref:aminotransferase class I/II-fold pyridoxal phosphate-dependent enzyme n=1 Tax=Algicola sagamiensis TaxID=163869 RepID=UPI000361AB9E|nr:aminotransferase class I/II-fold pyridoxal phosphate-dependent enzyme [Algicola sagamiensis]
MTSLTMESILQSVAQAKARGEQIFDFSLSNPNLGIRAEMKALLCDVINQEDDAMFGYAPSQGYCETRSAIAKHIQVHSTRERTAEDITIVPGAAGGLCVLMKALLEPGEEVIGVKPYFPSYVHYIEHANGHYIPVDCDPTFELDVDAIMRAITPLTKVILLNSPNNPSGRIYSAEKLQVLSNRLLDLREKEGRFIHVVSDEAYERVTYNGKLPPTIADYYPNCLRVVSFSKDLGFAGLRVGYIESTPQYREVKLQVRLGELIRNLGYVNTSTILQKALVKGLNLTVPMATYKEQCDVLKQVLDDADIPFVEPEGGLFLFAKAPNGDTNQFIGQLLNQGIVVVPGAMYGMSEYFRISTTVDIETIRASASAWKV